MLVYSGKDDEKRLSPVVRIEGGIWFTEYGPVEDIEPHLEQFIVTDPFSRSLNAVEEK